MNSRERVNLALNHKEADHVPFDMGGTGVSLVHKTAYWNLRKYLELPADEPKISFMVEQLAVFESRYCFHRILTENTSNRYTKSYLIVLSSSR